MARIGNVDGFRSNLVFGWACNRDRPAEPGRVALEVNGTLRTTITCDKPRPDLAARGIGTGGYGFGFNPTAFLDPGINACRLLFAGTNQAGTNEIVRNGEALIVTPRSAGPAGSAMVLDPDTGWNTKEVIGGLLAGALAGCQPERVHVLGTFNSGTNFFQQFLIANEIAWLRRHDHDVQPKHAPVQIVARLTPLIEERSRNRIVYAVSVRDPFMWIAAMKSNAYGCTFDAVDAPFVAAPFLADHEENNATRRRAGLSAREWTDLFSARDIVAFWNRYHGDWLEHGPSTVGPTMMVRYEDAVAAPCEMLRILRHALDLGDAERMVVNVGSAKKDHAVSGDFFAAKRKLMLRDALPPALSPEETAYVGRQLSRDVCRALRYDVGAGAASDRAAE